MSKIPFITTALGVNAIINGENVLIPKDHKNYETIIACLKVGDTNVVNLINEFKLKIQDFDGVDFQVVNGELLFRGKPYTNNVIIDHINKMVEKGYQAKPIINFLEKAEQNPNPESVKDLWKFMQNTGLAIADDGDVLAFKYVTKVSDMSDTDSKKAALIAIGAEYTDSYSCKYDYTPGRTPSIPRHLCKYEPGQDCGVGLHIGDWSYVKSQKYVLAGKFSPADVTSIGSNESRKIRVCRFHCLHIVDPNNINENGYKEPVYSVRDGHMSMSGYSNKHIHAPDGYVDYESAEHWNV
jgi:hypothetical protein